jgi:hypothetical protein
MSGNGLAGVAVALSSIITEAAQPPDATHQALCAFVRIHSMCVRT